MPDKKDLINFDTYIGKIIKLKFEKFRNLEHKASDKL